MGPFSWYFHSIMFHSIFMAFIFMGCTNIMGHEPLKIHGKFMYYACMITPLNYHDYFHGNFMAFGLVVSGEILCPL